jgi:hypothetical protein
MTSVDLRPDCIREVQVVVDGTWHDGDLEAYCRDRDGVSYGYVRWSTGPGQPNHLGWYGEDQLRRARVSQR